MEPRRTPIHGVQGGDGRNFRALRHRKVQMPPAKGQVAPLQFTTYSQTSGCFGRTEFHSQYDGIGNRLAYRDEVYNVNDKVPYRCRNVTTINATTVGATTKSTRVDRTFGHYGNVATETDLGDTAAAGDETYTDSDHVENVQDYVVGCKYRGANLPRHCGFHLCRCQRNCPREPAVRREDKLRQAWGVVCQILPTLESGEGRKTG